MIILNSSGIVELKVNDYFDTLASVVDDELTKDLTNYDVYFVFGNLITIDGVEQVEEVLIRKALILDAANGQVYLNMTPLTDKYQVKNEEYDEYSMFLKFENKTLKTNEYSSELSKIRIYNN